MGIAILTSGTRMENAKFRASYPILRRERKIVGRIDAIVKHGKKN